jgi:cobalt-zinc-cadmium efflux system protein
MPATCFPTSPRSAERPATAQRTYGYYRTEILAALINGATLVAVAIFIFVEAYDRLVDPPPVRGAAMMVIAAGGLVVNVLGLVFLHGGKDTSLNLRGAWLHVVGDTLGSVSAVVAGLVIWTTGSQWIDPVVSAVIGVLIVYSSWRLLDEAVWVLMESVPRGIDLDEVFLAMAAVPGVVEIHDLHIWSITSNLESLSAHVVVNRVRRPADALTELRNLLHDRFSISHVTIQLEPEGFEERIPEQECHDPSKQ